LGDGVAGTLLFLLPNDFTVFFDNGFAGLTAKANDGDDLIEPKRLKGLKHILDQRLT
jgi:hypothetical protein